MRIKDIEHHHPILKLLAGYMSEVVVLVNEISTENRLSFSMGRTIEMTVEYEGPYTSAIQPGARILINIEDGSIARVHLEQTETARNLGIVGTLVG